MTAKVGTGSLVEYATTLDPVFRRPVELVEISERIYRQLFAVGLWLAVTYVLYAALTALLQPATGAAQGAIVCGAFMPAVIVAALRPAIVYRLVRRRPWVLVLIGAILGAGATLIGAESHQLFLPIAVIIGVIGVATSCRVVAVAAAVAGVGLGAPQLASEHGNVATAFGVLVPPLMYWLIIDRIASFALRLHMTIGDEAGAPTLRTADEGEWCGSHAEPHTERNGGEQHLLPAAPVVSVAGIRLTGRQLQVILLACEGLRHAEIGACLGIGPQQVRRHLSEARRRTGTASTPQLVAWARHTGLVPGTAGSTVPDEHHD